MDLDRFQALADAFGGRLETWPCEEQAGAARLLARDPDAARHLASASELDRLLDDWTVLAPSPQLRARVLLHAPKPQARSSSWSWLRRFGPWRSGVGLAAAGLAGVICGAAASTAALADARDQALVASAASAGLGPLNSAADEGGSRAPGRPRIIP